MSVGLTTAGVRLRLASSIVAVTACFGPPRAQSVGLVPG